MISKLWLIFKRQSTHEALEWKSGHDGMNMITPGFTGGRISRDSLAELQSALQALHVGPFTGNVLTSVQAKFDGVVEVWG